MMTRPRSQQVSLDATPYYHCVSRCVRRAFLCGDAFEHRRSWVENRLLELASIFCIDVAAYAVMSNHYHVVLHIDQACAEALSVDGVIRRWHRLFKGQPLSQRYLAGQPLCAAELTLLYELVTVWRARLVDISWFMRMINEHIAREANAEDHCTGRFWEGRFKSQALLDEKALLACMAYVDLNPLRARMAKTPESSEFTSIKKRADDAQKSVVACKSPNAKEQQTRGLLPFVGNPKQTMPTGIPCALTDYLELVDWTGRIIRENKRGALPLDIPPILDRLLIEPSQWLVMSEHFEQRFRRVIGSVAHVRFACCALGYRRTACLGSCLSLLGV